MRTQARARLNAETCTESTGAQAGLWWQREEAKWGTELHCVDWQVFRSWMTATHLCQSGTLDRYTFIVDDACCTLHVA